MRRSPILAAIAGAVLTATLALAAAGVTGPGFAARLSAEARQTIAKAGGKGVTARFHTDEGWPSRHPILRGGERLDEATRTRTARAVAAIPGVGGVRWANGTRLATLTDEPTHPLHCQQDVEALLRTRTVRFEEGSAAIDKDSQELVDEVAAALRPCLGAIIAIAGHTDNSGLEPANLALSQARADAVRGALVRRGIPADGLRAKGLGSGKPVEGLDPADPANRRIEFSVITAMPQRPTPVDPPGPR